MTSIKPFNLLAKINSNVLQTRGGDNQQNSSSLSQSDSILHQNSIQSEQSLDLPPAIVDQSSDFNKHIKNCIEIPEEEWVLLKKGTFISYLRKDGIFRPGGYVLKQWIETQGPNKGIYHLKFIVGRYTWTIKHPDIKKMWKNPEKSITKNKIGGGNDTQDTSTHEAQTTQSNKSWQPSSDKITKVMQDQFTNVKILEKRIESLQTDIRRIYQILKDNNFDMTENKNNDENDSKPWLKF